MCENESFLYEIWFIMCPKHNKISPQSDRFCRLSTDNVISIFCNSCIDLGDQICCFLNLVMFKKIYSDEPFCA